MKFNEYQIQAHSTSLKTEIGGDLILYPCLKICGEVGEIAEKVGKLYRDKGGTLDEEQKEALIKELGDVLWYIAEVSTVIGVPLDQVALKNIQKLHDRMMNGTLQGDGDER